MKAKTARRIFLLLVFLPALLLLVGSCSLEPAGDTGSYQLILQGKALGDTIRVYLVTTDGVIAPLGDPEDYVEVAVTGDVTAITIQGLPAGAEYRAHFALGNKDSGVFVVEYYEISEPFTIEPGTISESDLGVLKFGPWSSVQTALAGKDLKDIIYDGSLFYTATSNTLYEGGTISAMAPAPNGTLPRGYSVNSLTFGANIDGDIWLNTNKGIVPYDNAANSLNTSSQLRVDIPTLDSGYFVDTNTYVYYQRNQGLGGVRAGVWDWIDIDLGGYGFAGQPVFDLVVLDSLDAGFFASVFGGFFLQRDMIDGGEGDFLVKGVSFALAGIVKVLALGYDAPNFYVGSADGLYTSTNPVAGMTLMPGTTGERFLKIASGGGDYAALSQTSLYVNGAKIPFVAAGLPGSPDQITGMLWQGGTLYVSGPEGLVALTP